jgi:RNA 2',3'-cyclic 3'-phosphodiesterase
MQVSSNGDVPVPFFNRLPGLAAAENGTMKRVRTFIAIDPGKLIREKLVVLQESLGESGADVRWVEPANLHLTLVFLGEVDTRDVVEVCRAAKVVTAGRPPFTMSVETVGAFPNLRRPRILWVGVGEGASEVKTIHDALENALLGLGCYRREERAYTPHLTLGRTKTEDASPELGARLLKKAAWVAGQATVNELLVMSSELMSGGPLYTVMGRAKLG